MLPLPIQFLVAFALLLTRFAYAQDITLHQDLEFAQHDNHSLKLDLAIPADNQDAYPTIVFIHGGGWQFGDRKIYLDEAQDAAQHGYVGVTVSYRLTNPDQEGHAQNPFPAQIQDVKAAIRWLRQHARQYHIDPNRIGVTGKSAGGHLSLLLGTTDPTHGFEVDDEPKVSTRVQAVVNCFGPTELISLHATSPRAGKLVETLLGGPPAKRADEYRRASPVTYVSAHDPPTITIHGRNDRLVPLDQAQQFDQAMRAVGANHTLLIIPDAGHGFQGPAAHQRDQARYNFFNKHLKYDQH